MADDPISSHPEGSRLNGVVRGVAAGRVEVGLVDGGHGVIHPPYLDNFQGRVGDSIVVEVAQYDAIRGEFALRPVGVMPMEERVRILESLKSRGAESLARAASLGEFLDGIQVDSIPFELTARHLQLMLSITTPLDVWAIAALTVGFDPEHLIDQSAIEEIDRRWSRIVPPFQ